jgi:hypothetical protein
MGLREGVLIYAQDPGDPEDPTEGNLVHSVEVKHAGTLLHTYRLPLAGSNADVEANIVRLADWITARTAIRNSSDARCLQMGSGGSA